MRRKIVAIVGDADIEENSTKYKMAYEMGKALVDAGYRIQSGGLQGVMNAAFCGAHASKNYKEGDTIAIVPGFNPNDANQFADITIGTGLDMFRNVIVGNAQAIIAIGGGSGTLSEVANAWALKRMILAFNNVDGWSSKVADIRMDQRIRYEDIPDDRVYGVSSAEEAIKIINERIEKYNIYHTHIPKNH
ncbi:MAG: acyl-CoA synthetase [Clostridia bacterium]